MLGTRFGHSEEEKYLSPSGNRTTRSRLSNPWPDHDSTTLLRLPSTQIHFSLFSSSLIHHKKALFLRQYMCLPFTHQSATVTRTVWQHRSQHLASFMNGLELYGRRLHTRRLLPHGVAKPSTPPPPPVSTY
jgi:hypothetical protein